LFLAWFLAFFGICAPIGLNGQNDARNVFDSCVTCVRGQYLQGQLNQYFITRPWKFEAKSSVLGQRQGQGLCVNSVFRVSDGRTCETLDSPSLGWDRKLPKPNVM